MTPCPLCGGKPADRKVAEEIPRDDLMPDRHPATNYVCSPCFGRLMNGAKQAMSAPDDRDPPAVPGSPFRGILVRPTELPNAPYTTAAGPPPEGGYKPLRPPAPWQDAAALREQLAGVVAERERLTARLAEAEGLLRAVLDDFENYSSRSHADVAAFLAAAAKGGGADG